MKPDPAIWGWEGRIWEEIEIESPLEMEKDLFSPECGLSQGEMFPVLV